MSGAEYYTNESRWGARFGSVKFHDRLEAREGDSLPRGEVRLHFWDDRDRREPGQRI